MICAAIYWQLGYLKKEIAYKLNILSKAALVTGAIIALTALNKAAASGTLNFYPANIKSIGFDGITPVATLGLAIQNPSTQSFTINSLVGNLTANGILIGNVSSFTPVTVNASSQQVYYLSVRLSLLGIVNDLIKAFNGGGVSQTIEFKAYANVNNYTIPLTITYKVP